MSNVFSRRSFLKYSAVTAAVAGAGLLSSCSAGDIIDNIISDPKTATLKTFGTNKAVLQVTATLKKSGSTVTGNDLVFNMEIKNGRTNPIEINANHFKVVVTHGTSSKKYTSTNGLTVSEDLADPKWEKNSTASGTVNVTVSDAVVAGDTVTLAYFPDMQYNEYSAVWVLTVTE